VAEATVPLHFQFPPTKKRRIDIGKEQKSQIKLKIDVKKNDFFRIYLLLKTQSKSSENNTRYLLIF
jgi:hypothetical protein